MPQSIPDRAPAAARLPPAGPLPGPDAVHPLFLVLAIVVGGYALLFMASIVAQVPVRLIDGGGFGQDFDEFWTSAADVLAGRDPYLRPRFVTPPPSLLPFLALMPLPRPQAAAAFLCIDVAALAAGIAALAKFYRLRTPVALALALVCALSPSAVMLLDRGNLDGLVFLFLCLFVTLRADGVAGPLALAAAIGLKLYPAVFLPALVAQRRVKAAVLAAGAVAAAAVLTPSAGLAVLSNQVARAGGMRVDGNLSALAPFWVIDSLLQPGGAAGLAAHPAMLAGVLLYAGALGACLWHDAGLIGRVGRPDARLLLASYAGFCVSMPSLVYLYSGVCLFVPLAALGQEGLSASPARRRDLASALGLTMLPALSFHLTLGAGWPGAFNILPIAGSLLFIVAAVGLRLDLRRRTAADEAATGPAWAGADRR